MKRYLFFVSTFLLLLTSCINEEMVAVYNDDPVAMSVKASIGVENSGASTRSAITSFSATDYLGIFIDDAADPDAYTPIPSIFSKENTGSWILAKQYIGSTPAWTTDGISSILLSTKTANVYGFYPVSYNAPAVVNTADKTIPVTIYGSDAPDNAQTIEALEINNQLDYMYAFETAETPNSLETVSKNSSTATLTLMHALSKLTFVINKGATFGGAGKLTQIKLSKTGENYFKVGAGTMSLADGVITPTVGTHQNLYFTSATGLDINAYNVDPSAIVTTSVLVAPTTIGTNVESTYTPLVTIELTIDGQAYSTSIPVSFTYPSLSWNAGTDYKYTITVNGASLTIGTVSISAWGAGTNVPVSID